MRIAFIAAVGLAASVSLAACSSAVPTESVAPSATVSAPASALDDRPVQEQLVEAVVDGDVALAALALEAGADPSLYDPDTNNGPLSLAITRDDVAMVTLLLDYGAAVEWPEFDYSELEVAAQFAGAEVVELLLAAGANPEGVGAGLGAPLAAAAYSGNIPALEALLNAGANPDGTSTEDGAYPPLFTAAYGGEAEAALMLLDFGANPAVRAPDGYAPSDWAESQGHSELAATLRDFGA